MASSPSREGTVRLRVSAGSPLAEVFLVDRDFALVGRAIGELDVTVAPGVYKVKAKVADASTEELVVLDADLKLDLSGKLGVTSPAPIRGTSCAGRRDMAIADDRSTEAPRPAGEGARLFLMVRTCRSAEPASGGPGAPLEATLHRPDGTLVATPEPSTPDVDDSVRTVNAEVDPGAYFLRWSDETGVTAEQCVHAVRGWQTQIFVLEDASQPAEVGRTRVSVLMGRDGFNSRERQLRIAEVARTALAGQRKVAAAFLNQTLPERFENPMLGLFGAHLMLIARDAERGAAEARSRRSDAPRAHPDAPVAFEQPRFDTVVGALRELLGAGHPDVVALSTQVTSPELGALEPAGAPPMLWRSWVLLIEASNAAPALVPVETWRRTINLLPLRPFLLWSPAAGDAADGDDWMGGVEHALATAKRAPRQQPDGEGPLASLLSASAAEVAEPGPVEVGDDARERVSRELLAPRAAIDQVAAPPAR
jgi:hypothetical protein